MENILNSSNQSFLFKVGDFNAVHGHIRVTSYILDFLFKFHVEIIFAAGSRLLLFIYFLCCHYFYLLDDIKLEYLVTLVKTPFIVTTFKFSNLEKKKQLQLLIRLHVTRELFVHRNLLTSELSSLDTISTIKI
jgi:hypothetical protein